MANLAQILPENVPGDFFVDRTCIDCDTCRQLAPAVFGETGEFSFVRRQPTSADQRRDALRALVCCPTGSIGTRGASAAKTVLDDFPSQIEDEVYYCGFNSPKSFGGNSYFIRSPAGNWLVDSPKFLPRLVKNIERLGGIKYIFLTHQDDVADAEQFAAHFRATRIIHRADIAAQPDAEYVVAGQDPVRLADGFVAIPTPGHTRGHMVLHYRNKWLFTGDHLWWDRDSQRLSASRSYCWYSWPEQVRSMERLVSYPFEWVLPGHGQRVYLLRSQMREALADLLLRLKV
jgi:glyoxylase-like metal-dependent hydrolase (beta-lactamase superfamily II)/ferredoxin